LIVRQGSKLQTALTTGRVEG
jgi:hypothetical protein